MKRTNVFSSGGIIKNKKYIISLFIALFGIVSLFGGASYAILKGVNSDSNEQVIKTGSVKLKLTENYETINKKISIMGDEEGLLQEKTYDFNIKNIGSSPAKYDLKLINEVPSSYTGKVLDTKYIKVGLEINGEEYGPMSLEKVKNIIDSDIIYKNEIINYKLRIWLDKSKEEEISKLEDYKAFLKLKIEAEQRPESMDTKDATKTFNYTGDVQEYIVPRDGYYYIEMAGGAGGAGSKGAKLNGYVKLNAGEKLYFYVGKQGSEANTNCRTSGYEFNGGGIALPGKSGICGSTGGGATDVRLVGGSWDDTKSLISRIMVAGAGGGTTDLASYTIPNGGTLYGTKPIFSTYQSNIGYEGTQIAGGKTPTKDSCAQSTGTAGSFGKGGYGGANNATNVESGGGSGGGSGYYGGSGASGLCNGTWPGGGGSSYISGYAGVNSVENNITITHTNQTIHYSGKYFIGGEMLEGQNSGDGYAKISFVDTKPKRRNTKLNNIRYIKDCINYSSANNYNLWTEIEAIKDGVNIAKGKTVTGTTSELSTRPYSRITDGDIDPNIWAQPATEASNQCVTVDLGQTYDLDEVAVWNNASDTRAYHDSITYVSSDNKTFNEIINEANIQTSNGRRKNAYTNTINGYIQDKLNLWYDGLANSGNNHLQVLSSWKDLSGKSHNGSISSGTWLNNNLQLPNTTVDTGIPLSTALPATKDSTLSITMKVNSLPYTNTTYGNTVVFLGATHYSGMGIFATIYKDYFVPQVGIRTTSGITNAYYKDYTAPTKIITLDFVNDTTNGKIITYLNGIKMNEDKSITGSYEYTSNIGNIGINKAQIFAGNGTTSSGNINVYSVKIYYKALTEEEITHNYNYDKQKFNIE